tara:strand:- start:985 stop:1263 length:279 start_codon:yes stop_codon:yes gene_type:complete
MTKEVVWDPVYCEHWFRLMKPGFHYLQVKSDLSNLIEVVEWCIHNYDNTKQIGKNEFAKQNLTLYNEVTRLHNALFNATNPMQRSFKNVYIG